MAKSPCIDICRFDQATGWCEGCGWTRKEAGSWKKLSPFHRVSLERDLRLRLKRLSAKSIENAGSPDTNAMHREGT